MDVEIGAWLNLKAWFVVTVLTGKTWLHAEEDQLSQQSPLR